MYRKASSFSQVLDLRKTRTSFVGTPVFRGAELSLKEIYIDDCADWKWGQLQVALFLSITITFTCCPSA